MTGRPLSLKVAAVVVAIFCLLTIVTSGRALFAGVDIGAVAPFALRFNFAAGFASMLAGVGLWWGPWAWALSAGIASATAAVFAAFLLHVWQDGIYEARTTGAMILRTGVGSPSRRSRSNAVESEPLERAGLADGSRVDGLRRFTAPALVFDRRETTQRRRKGKGVMAGVAFALLIAAMAVLVLFGDRESIGGLTPAELAGLTAAIALAIPFLQRVRAAYGGQWSKGMQALAFWLAAIVLLVGVHAYRFELSDIANRVLGAFIPGAAIMTRGGEVRIARQDGGAFMLNGRVNDTPARFIFDTGATAVVLTSETARRAGLRIAEDAYVARVTTANGVTTAAPTRIAELAIGGIVERDVRALVARPDALRENLLGMSFMERLSGYRVEGDQLILRAR